MTADPVTPSGRLRPQGMLAAAGVVAVVTLLGRAVGLARWFVFSATVGTTCVGHVYSTTNQVPNVLFEIVAGGALAAVAVPLLAGHLAAGREDLADRAASALLTWALTLLLPLSLALVLMAGPLAGVLVGGVHGCAPEEATGAARLMLLLFAPQVLLYGLGVVLSGVLQAHRRFVAAALAPLLSSLVVIAVYLAFGAVYGRGTGLGELPRAGLLLLAGGTTLGVVALTLPLALPAARLGIRWRPTWRFPTGSGRLAGALALAGLAAVAAQQLFVVVLLLVNGVAGVGTITVWTYAQTAYLLPYAVLVVPLATVAFPRMTPGSAEAVPVLRRALAGAVVASVVGASVLVATHTTVGRLFLLLDAGSTAAGRGSLQALPVTLLALAPGLVGFALTAVVSRALYAAGRPGSAAAPAVLGWALAALLPLLLLGGHASLPPLRALVVLGTASSIGMTVSGVLLLVQLRRTWGSVALRGLTRTGAVVVLGAALGVAAGALVPEPGSGWWALLADAVVRGLIVLAAATLALGVGDRRALSVLRGKMPSSISRT